MYQVSAEMKSNEQKHKQTNKTRKYNLLFSFYFSTSYTMKISVSDRGSPSLSSSSTIVVTVTDVNDNSPIFAAASYQKTVKENSVKGTKVLKVMKVFSNSVVDTTAVIVNEAK